MHQSAVMAQILLHQYAVSVNHVNIHYCTLKLSMLTKLCKSNFRMALKI